MIKLDITNFRNLREVHLIDDTPLSVVVGYNEAGKSSLTGAIQWVLTGQAYGLKGSECDQLLSWGQERMHTRLELEGKLFNRTRSGGDTIKENAARLGVAGDVLPILFHQPMNSDGGNKHLKAFLTGAIADAFNAAEYFAADPDISVRITKAKNTGSRTARQIVSYCETQRAGCKPPIQPLMPAVIDINDIALKELDDQYAVESGVAQVSVTELAEMERLAEQLQAVATFTTQQAAYETLAARAREGDSLGARRTLLEGVVSLRPGVLNGLESTLKAAGFDADISGLSKQLAAAQVAAAAELAAHPAVPIVGARPSLDATAEKAWQDLGSPKGDELQDTIRYALSEIRRLREQKQAAQSAASKIKARRDQALADRGAWDSYRKAIPGWEDAKAEAEVAWQRWDMAAKAIARAELEHIARAGTLFEGLITEFSAALLNGRKITVSPTDGIRLSDLPVESTSLSTRWRIEVCVMASIARYLKSPLLIVDGADILDARNTVKFTDFILKSIVPHFSHTLVTATCRGDLRDEKPLTGATKWTLDTGVLSKVS